MVFKLLEMFSCKTLDTEIKLSFLKEVGLKKNPIIPTNNIIVFLLFFVCSEVSEIILLLVEV